MTSTSNRPGAPLLTIRPGATPIGQYLADLWRHRDLVSVLAVRDIKLRYRQTALGASWVLLQPLLGAGVLSFVFNRVAKLPAEGAPYFVFAYAGFLTWTAFSSTLVRSSTSLVQGQGLVSKIFFPRVILPFSTVFAALLDFVVASLVLVVMCLSESIFSGWRLLSAPLWLGLILLLSLGAGLLLAGIAVTYRDVAQITPVAVQLLLYASPVGYSASAVPARYRTLYHLNPISALVEQFRWSVLDTAPAKHWYVIYSTAWAVGLFLIGTFVLARYERKFADVV
jgi:lipopolysaccharide transport system permease protein